MKYRVLPYKQGSRSAKALATALGGLCLKIEGSSWVPKPLDIVINWGNTTPQPTLSGANVLNPPAAIKTASNKLLFFRNLKDEGLTPQYWENKNEIPVEAFPIVCRTVLAGHSGAGIVISSNVDTLVDAPLYVKYEKKQDEYRIHVGRTFGEAEGEAPEITTVSVQRKARRLEVADPNWQVRNHANGFVYVRGDVDPPAAVIAAAHQALALCGLDFGAVDVIWNAHKAKAFVLEINTAPGLEGQTVVNYAAYFKGE